MIATSPRVLADTLAELTEKAAAHAMARYPHDQTERLADEAAQLRTLLKVAVDQLRRMGEKP